MISRWDYKKAGHRRTYQKAKTFKAELKKESYRVKIRKAIGGGYDIFIKDLLILDKQEGHGNGRRRVDYGP